MNTNVDSIIDALMKGTGHPVSDAEVKSAASRIILKLNAKKGVPKKG